MPDEVTRWFPAGDTVGIELDVLWDAVGRIAPTAQFVEEDRALASGSWLRHVRHRTRELVVPIHVRAPQAELPVRIRELAYALDPLRGDGRMRVTRSDGTSRDLTCRVLTGLEGIESLGEAASWEHQTFKAVFRAHDPYWYDTVDTTVTVAPYGDSYDFNVTVDSDVQDGVWPIWTWTGPMESFSVMQRDTLELYSINTITTATGETLSGVLAAGQTCVVDTRPGIKSVVSDTGRANWMPNLSGHTFALRPGLNRLRAIVEVQASGMSLTLRYRSRHLTC